MPVPEFRSPVLPALKTSPEGSQVRVAEERTRVAGAWLERLGQVRPLRGAGHSHPADTRRDTLAVPGVEIAPWR